MLFSCEGIFFMVMVRMSDFCLGMSYRISRSCFMANLTCTVSTGSVITRKHKFKHTSLILVAHCNYGLLPSPSRSQSEILLEPHSNAPQPMRSETSGSMLHNIFVSLFVVHNTVIPHLLHIGGGTHFLCNKRGYAKSGGWSWPWKMWKVSNV